MRILVKELPGKVGQSVTLRGWLHKKRLLGGLNFILLRDRSGVAQALIKNEAELEKLRSLQIGTVLTLTGTVASDERAPGGVELHDVQLSVEVPVEDQPPVEIDKPLSHESENLDTLFDYRVVGLRNLKEQAVFKIQAQVIQGFWNFMNQSGATEIHTPKLLAAATEGGAEVFKMDYFGKEATLAQSPQFYKQIMVGVFERVFEIAPVYRAEPSATSRHMTEYISLDGEFGFIDENELMKLLSNMLNSIANDVWAQCQAELGTWQAQKPVLSAQIPALTMAEIHHKYSEATGTNTVGEDDLRPDEERWICDYAKENLGSEAVFVTEWPAASAKFYHKLDDNNPNIAIRMDLLFRGVEVVTASMREHRYPKLVEQLRTMAGGDPENPGFKHFLSAMKAGMPPHGGFGMGLERLTQKLIGLHNVKEASLFPRDINRLTP